MFWIFFECFRTNFGYLRNCSGYFRSSSGYFGNSSGYCTNSSEYFRSSSGYLRNSSGLRQTKRPMPLLNVYTIVLHAFALSFPGILSQLPVSPIPTAAWPGGVACSSNSAARNPRPSVRVSLVAIGKGWVRHSLSFTVGQCWPDVARVFLKHLAEIIWMCHMLFQVSISWYALSQLNSAVSMISWAGNTSSQSCKLLQCDLSTGASWRSLWQPPKCIVSQHGASPLSDYKMSQVDHRL